MATRPSQIFGSNVFDLATMKKKLPKATYKSLTHAIENGTKLTLEHASAIAHVMMEWALEKGATHYTHLFQPMTGLTAQKHDSFFNFDSQLGSIEAFSGSDLIQSEPDASSFPSGGMRSTFEARGYTTWDPSSPVYLMEASDVIYLCIPSVFFSYTGQTLDKKTPLLRSIRKLASTAAHAIKLIDGREVTVEATVGCEQEYFLVDKQFFDRRPDLIMAGRTLLGARPAKGQQMEDHYFGSIKDRVLSYMQDMEQQLYKLGVPCKTRHNEVAPHQYEIAPIFEPANLAADHNQLMMEVMRRVAKDHGLAALLHEKPFANVNGSGKHVNWSMQASDGTNLLEPGHAPHRNMVFLYFLVAVVNAIHKNGGVLRSTVSGPGNDHRLGANEAPPAIMSVFLGTGLTNILDDIEHARTLDAEEVESIDLGLANLPDIQIHNTDRNRTSPFAFTGNKFEFRAVGSSQSVSIPIAIINAAVTESLLEMNAELEKLPEVTEKALLAMLRPFITRSRPVCFEGNNYSEEWAIEAAKRGLPNNRNTPQALSVWEDENVRRFVRESGILNDEEMEARYHVRMEHYTNIRNIEAELLLRMVNTHVLPACFKYQKDVAESLQALKVLGITGIAAQENQLRSLSNHISSLLGARDGLMVSIEAAENQSSLAEKGAVYASQVVPCMEEVRSHADTLEELLPAKDWELPTYHELLFLM